VRAARPHLPCLFMSGYARPILDFYDMTGPGVDILEKPFTETSLLT
jgi:FixJ family two-component response regulator